MTGRCDSMAKFVRVLSQVLNECGPVAYLVSTLDPWWPRFYSLTSVTGLRQGRACERHGADAATFFDAAGRAGMW